ncbi:hypothetical protein A2U01_0097693, partial [Trifolium medium]|nr:hypothetical protein [Trifolium medium]
PADGILPNQGGDYVPRGAGWSVKASAIRGRLRPCTLRLSSRKSDLRCKGK